MCSSRAEFVLSLWNVNVYYDTEDGNELNEFVLS